MNEEGELFKLSTVLQMAKVGQNIQTIRIIGDRLDPRALNNAQSHTEVCGPSHWRAVSKWHLLAG